MPLSLIQFSVPYDKHFLNPNLHCNDTHITIYGGYLFVNIEGVNTLTKHYK